MQDAGQGISRLWTNEEQQQADYASAFPFAQDVTSDLPIPEEIDPGVRLTGYAARLVAAAPAMLLALEKIEAFAKYHAKGMYDARLEEAAWKSILKLSRSAIAMANADQ